MREAIVEIAKKNAEVNSVNFDDLHLVKLQSIKNLDDVKDLMCVDAKDSLTDQENRAYIQEDIASGITFAFWFNEDNELEYSR